MSKEEKQEILDFVNFYVLLGIVRLSILCFYIGVSERSIQRWNIYGVQDKRKGAPKKVVRKLSTEQRTHIYNVACSSEYKDLNLHEIYNCLLDKGIYLASESTFYRILREHHALTHRRETKENIVRKKPDELRATAKKLFMELTLKEKAQPQFIHSDNGNAMKGLTFIAFYYRLGIAPSFSRPRVSDDNPYIESFFKTLKYSCGYPRFFTNLTHARTWFASFIHWYNNEHMHSGLQYVTPHQKRTGAHIELFAKRNAVLELAKQKYPLRWGNRYTKKYQATQVEVLNPKATNVA